MKCPKCDYLGFETGDRCKNCGYDFSLMTEPMPSTDDADLMLQPPDPFAGPNEWLNQLDRELKLAPSSLPASTSDPLAPLALDTIAVPTTASAPAATPLGADTVVDHLPASPPRVASGRSPALPLFQRAALDDDEPLIKVPAAPRAPLSVRRTPETPRLRAVPKTAQRPVAETAVAPPPAPEPVLDFLDDPGADAPLYGQRAPIRRRNDVNAKLSAATADPNRRLAAAALDHLILLSIDAVVVYLTLQMAALTLAEWRVLPVLPLLTFLGLVKGAYFCAFTLVGGQTIGKMAAHIRVVTLDGRDLDPARAVRRTLAGALSIVSLGLTFVPVLLATDRRAVHDHLARTRVIATT